MTSVFLIDPDTGRRTGTERYLSTTGGYHVRVSDGPGPSPGDMTLQKPDAIVLFDDAHGQSGLALIASLEAQGTDIPVIVVAEIADPLVAAAILEHPRPVYLSITGPVQGWYPVLHRVIERTIAASFMDQKVLFLEKKLEIVGGVTRHDVQNQLTAVVGYTELLEMTVTDPKERSFIDKERAALNKIRLKFQYAKDYQNIGTEPPQWQKISSVIHRTIDTYDLKSIRIEDSCGEAAVFADLLFEKAIASMIDNTIRFGGKATVVHLFLKEEPGAPVLVVEDDGVGIAAENKEKIFDRGFGENTGWGLFLAREILAVTGITLTETGTPGTGARFELRIPPDYFRR
ncbi:MAG: ATP-binding protein [Methanoregula sp.]